MIQKITVLAFGLFTLIACNNEVTQPKVSITTSGISDSPLKITVAGTDSVLANGQLSSGTAALPLNLSHPQMISIEIEGLDKPVIFFADLSEMTVDIKGDVDPPSFKVIGSVYNDSLEAFGEAQTKNQAFLQSLYPAWEEAMQANDSLTMTVITERADSAYTGFTKFTQDFAERNGILGAMIAQRFLYSSDYDDLIAIYENIPVKYKNADDVVKFKERMDILELTQIGKRFIDIRQNDTTGTPFSISEVKGEYTLIDFWASWCAPCRKANPDLVQLYADFHERGFEIVGVSLDQKAPNWKKAIVDDQLIWPQMSDLKGWGNEGSAAYAIRSIPQSVMIDNQGFIVNKNLTPEEIRAFLEDNL